jgi:hypothetical protein
MAKFLRAGLCVLLIGVEIFEGYCHLKTCPSVIPGERLIVKLVDKRLRQTQ